MSERRPEAPAARRLDEAGDATRRTHLANERTQLAWWRTGLTALAVSLAVGSVVPELGGSTRWPYAVVGAGYALLGIGLIAFGSWRQQDVAEAVREGGFAHVGRQTLNWMTALALVLGVLTLVLVIAEP